MLMSLVAACDSSVRESKERPCRELEEIDSLLWTQPDSALTRLIQCYDTVSDRHYANLLLAELLYKNDYEQTNRSELLEAVAYYDSVFDPFLAARAHYINGVGYYERDSVVLACKEYQKAVETMEEHFTEKELVGEKAHFMAMSLTRLYSLYSNQYLHEQALFFGKASLVFYQKYNASPRHIAWMLDEIGSHYDMMNNCDSAAYYYEKSLSVLPDTNSLTYRDVATRQAFLVYKKGKDPGRSLDQLQELLGQAESSEERLSRYSIIGAIFYHEKLYDSALVYLNMVFQESQRIDSKKQAAEWLVEIYKHQGESPELFAEFLVPFANKEENKSAVKSQLSELYNNHKQRQTDFTQQKKTKKQFWLLGIIAVTVIGIGFLVYWNHRKKIKAQEKIIAEQQEESLHLRSTYERLESELKKKNVKPLDVTGLYKDFRKEPACQHIISSIRAVHIKTERKVSEYKESALSQTTYSSYLAAIDKHCKGFLKRLKNQYPNLTNAEAKLCCLVLLDLGNKEMAVLLQISHQAVGKQMNSLLKKTGIHREELFAFLANIAFNGGE